MKPKGPSLEFVFLQNTDLRFVLFQYETDSAFVRRKFDEHGEIKTFFDLISNRGMVFVTYVSSDASMVNIYILERKLNLSVV